jgi:hypothetical protein
MENIAFLVERYGVIAARGSSKRMPLRLRFPRHQPETRQDQRAASGQARL